MKTFYTLFIALLLSISCFAQTYRFEWIQRIGDSGDEYLSHIINDSAGNLYAAGGFVGQLIFGSDTLNNTSILDPAAFLVKYDTAGSILWAKKPPTALSSYKASIHSIRLSPSGKVYLLGASSNGFATKEYLAVYRSNGALVGYADQAANNTNMDADFDSVDNAYIIGSNATSGPYLYKLDSSGNLKWSYFFTSSELQYANIRYIKGAVHIAGQFRHQVQFKDTVGTTPITLSASGGINDWDFFYALYSKDGKLLSASRHQGLSSSAAGPFDYSADFTFSNNWHIASVDPLFNASVTTYTPSFSVTGSRSLKYIDSCIVPPSPYIKGDRFSNQSVFSYSGIICNSAKVYLLDSAGKMMDSVSVPTAGPRNYVPVRDFSFDGKKNLYVTSDFKGSFSYMDKTGTHTMSSNAGSVDLYIGKYHRCADYNPILTKRGDTVICSVSGLSYQWFHNNMPDVLPNQPAYYIPQQSGNIKVVVSDTWGCVDTSNLISVTVTPNSILALEMGSGIKIFPNPAKTSIIVSGIPKGELIRIVDIVGRIALEQMANGHSEMLSIGWLSPGVYVLQISNAQLKFFKD